MEPIDVTPTEIVQSRQASLAMVSDKSMSVLDLIGRMIDRGGNIDVNAMKGLQEMHQIEKQRAAERAFNASYAEFRAQCPQIRKTAENTYYKVTRNGREVNSTYAPLDDVDSIVTPLAAQFGLSHSFGDATVDGANVTMSIIVTHRDGFSRTNKMTLPVKASTKGELLAPQFNSTMSLLRRLLICAAYAIVGTDRDLDGQEQEQDVSAAPANLSEQEDRDLNDLFLLLKSTDKQRAAILKWVGAESVAALTTVQYERLMGELDRQAKERGLRK